MNIGKLILSYVVILLIGISAAIFTIIKVQELADNTKKMYTHPFTVSNAVADIQTSIITMHRNMKDVVLSKSNLEILLTMEQVQKEESKVINDFNQIYKFYLGDKQDIDKSFQLFKDWKLIRDEVILNMTNHRIEEAIEITKGKGAKHIENLYAQIKILKSFAFNKADEFYSRAIDNNVMYSVILVTGSSLLISGLVVLWMVLSIVKANQLSNKQMYLIDQNILSATLSFEKDILKISSSLCRILNVKKKDILSQKADYFFTTPVQFEQFENQIYTGKEYQGEVYVEVDNVQNWFNIEVFPEIDNMSNLTSFSIILTDISNKKKIEEISIHDSLSGLYNRNYFEATFDKEVKRACREQKSLSIILLDIDYFKQYNDTYGHQEGDNVIIAIASVLSKHSNRPYDYAFRIGGEEFLILTYLDTPEKTEMLADTLIKEVEALQIAHKNSAVSKYVTISIGAIQFPSNHTYTSNEMFKRADEFLYQSKTSGRNKFTFERANNTDS
ncbi:MAG: diguanylate cyclase [Gammaproteobacteria bacterium]|nr:diguanylate cyclase [Gammaproteobacteria bacterium]